ncbi:MAG: translational GTPase TypA [Myxococcales bacterium]|nr:translational GTPase TypA [Myxococcales bacterium]
MSARKDLRNLAIIAHVDHGKTTLVDGLFRQTGTFGDHEAVTDRAMDSGDLERERGITILAKNTSVEYQGVQIHLVDTPGHADFGGEVERILGMVDGVLLLVDAVEGVMPQTRFVVRKAIDHGLAPIVVVNKIDRPEQRAHEVVDEVFDLLASMGASDEQLDFPVVYACAKEGTAALDPEATRKDLFPLLDAILEHIPAPDVDVDGPLRFQAVTLGYDSFVGRLVIGRVARGVLRRGEIVQRVGEHGAAETFRVTKLFGARGLERVELEEAAAGEIVTLAGVDAIEIGDTICPKGEPDPLPRIEIEPPTMRVSFLVNNSPFAGKSGKFLTGRQLRDRLEREALTNVSIRIAPANTGDGTEVSGRGELQLAILIETLRREQYEFGVSRPEIIVREIDGVKCEPWEEVVVEVPDDFQGIVMEKMAGRKARMEAMEHRDGRVLLRFSAPSRGLFGYRSEFLTDTRGEGVLYRTVRGYEPHAGDLESRSVGAIVASEQGQTTAYALHSIQERATMFVGVGLQVYEGQVVGENRRAGDMNVNVVRAKKLNNIRAAGKDEATVVTTPRKLTIESALEWIADDELLEVTPDELRLRKRILSRSHRKR